ncbi:MAG: Hpt domain-containing protein [Candidatus Thiosymbion ectosymbiont of Robbea hypermnestra]|nr:Hpt domain-containing protein [Candidatus Thiosymbion ectosymbiont of Robbea hypermnestra]
MEKNRENSAPVATDNPPVWDEAAALEITGGNPELARELVQMLVQGFPQELCELRRGFETNDWPLLVETAHRLHGATSYCGVPVLDARVGALEESARTGDRKRIAASLARVEREMERLTRVVMPDG